MIRLEDSLVVSVDTLERLYEEGAITRAAFILLLPPRVLLEQYPDLLIAPGISNEVCRLVEDVELQASYYRPCDLGLARLRLLPLIKKKAYWNA